MRVFFGADSGGPFISLSRGRSVVAVEHGAPFDDVLSLFDRVLASAGVKPEELDSIVVDRGPGGFSAVRRRLAAATSLAYGLGLPIAGCGPMTPEAAAKLPDGKFKLSQAIHPRYDGAPNITVSKKSWKNPAKKPRH